MLFDSVPNTSIESLKLARETVLIRNRGRFVTVYDEELLALAFPDLFPFGFLFLTSHFNTHSTFSIIFDLHVASGQIFGYVLFSTYALLLLKTPEHVNYPLLSFHMQKQKCLLCNKVLLPY